MKLILLFTILVFVVAENEKTNKLGTQNNNTNVIQKVLLRKLRNVEQREAKRVTWNEILADVLVNKITNKADTEYEHNTNILNKCFSDILWMFKTHIYDKFAKRPKTSGTDNELNVYNVKRDGSSEVEHEIVPTVEYTNKDGPKAEVELVEPAYHGKIKNVTEKEVGLEHPTTEEETRKNSDEAKSITEPVALSSSEVKCPEGYEVKDGKCFDPKSSKFILYIPNQCPNGYQRDWLGYCREMW